MSLGQNLSELRKSKGITQKELAVALNVTVQAISKWENDVCYPSADIYPVIARFYGVSIDQLFGYCHISYEDTLNEVLENINAAESSSEKIRIIADGLKRFHNSKELKLLMISALTEAAHRLSPSKERSTIINKAIKICLDISSASELSDETDTILCHLCELYMLQGNLNQALFTTQQISENNYDKRIKNEATIISRIYDFDNLVMFCKNNIDKCYKTVSCLIELLRDAYVVSKNDDGIEKLNEATQVLDDLYNNYII